jgi:response regulator NasT
MMNLDPKVLLHERSILLVDDDRLILSTLTSGLTRAGYRISSAESVDEAEAYLKNNELPDLVILDVRMHERSGLELASLLEEYDTPFILLTAHSEQDIIQRAVASGAMGYLVKPVDITQMIPAIETALSRSQELHGLRRSKEQLQTALDSNRAVSVAVGIVMDQHLINHDDALELLRKTARSKHLKLIELASSIVSSREILNLRNGA